MSVKILAKNDEKLKSVLQGTALFRDLSEEEILSCLTCSKAESITLEKGEMVFSEEDYPAALSWDGFLRREKKNYRYL